jgi:hypothetical protein
VKNDNGEIMAEVNHPNDEADRKTPKDTALNRMLDIALAKYAMAEPRTGLEDRILANIRAEQARAAEHAWWRPGIWRWGLAAAIAAIVVAAVGVTLNLEKPPQPLVKNPPSVPARQNETQEQETQAARRNEAPPKHELARHAITHSIQPKTVAEAYPKLDRFPSPQPLSEQEKLLLEYVKQHPEEALLAAKTQQEFDAEIHDLQQATTQTGPSRSDQQER